MTRGQIGALDYRMTFPPTPQPQGEAVVQNAQVAPQLPPLENDPLAVREKLTSDYYNNYNLLRNFALDMSKQGVNVFEPDYTQDGGGLPFQTYQKLQAGLMYAANALKNEFEAEKQTRSAELSGQSILKPGVNRQDLYAQDPSNFISTRLPAGVTEANQRLAQETNTPQDQARLNKLIEFESKKIDDQVAQGLISPEEGQYYKQQLVPNVWRTQMFAPRTGSGPSEQDILGRAELIKQVKRGIVTQDQTPLNMLKLIPNVEDVQYVNTGRRVGIEVFLKGQGQPSFIDLSAGKGEGDINALLNRIEGQKNIPNEAVFKFDTAVEIPKSNAAEILDDVKNRLSKLPDSSEIAQDVFPKIQELAAQGALTLPTGEPISSAELDLPRFFGDNKLIIKHYKMKNGKVDYSRIVEKKISDPIELQNLVEFNANVIAPAFGGGFIDQEPEVKNKGGKKIW